MIIKSQCAHSTGKQLRAAVLPVTQGNDMKQLNSWQLDQLSEQARQSARLRMNTNFHEVLEDPVQRLAIAMEPDTVIRPHRHLHTWELLLPLRGRFVVLWFDDQGAVTERVVLGQDCAVQETPAGVWHAVLSLDAGGVIFEVKQGPYRPFTPLDYAPGFADDDVARDAALNDWYAQAQPGGRLWSGS